MALDFPAAPVQGDRYTPPTGPSFVFDGGIWKPVVAGMRAVAMVHVIANRNTAQESIPNGSVRGIVGQITLNVGGWTTGSTPVGGSGYDLIVPVAGNYVIRNRTYFNPGAGSPSGRLNITLNGALTGNFVQPPAAAAGAITQECTTVNALIAGQLIAYMVDMAATTFYHASGHTEVEIYRIPDQWEAA